MISEEEIHNLISTIEDNSSKQREKCPKEMDRKFDAGAVWHGDWSACAEVGSFGKSGGKAHFAMILWEKKVAVPYLKKRPGVRLAPITSSRKSGRRAVSLPSGELRTARRKEGYILPQVMLIICKSSLVEKCEFKQFLDYKYIEQCKEALNNG